MNASPVLYGLALVGGTFTFALFAIALSELFREWLRRK